MRDAYRVLARTLVEIVRERIRSDAEDQEGKRRKRSIRSGPPPTIRSWDGSRSITAEVSPWISWPSISTVIAGPSSGMSIDCMRPATSSSAMGSESVSPASGEP